MLCGVRRSWARPSRLGGRFGAPPQVGEFVTDFAELLGEQFLFGAAFAEVLHADTVGAEGAPVCLLEDLAGVAGRRDRADGLGVDGGKVEREFMLARRGRWLPGLRASL